MADQMIVTRRADFISRVLDHGGLPSGEYDTMKQMLGEKVKYIGTGSSPLSVCKHIVFESSAQKHKIFTVTRSLIGATCITFTPIYTGENGSVKVAPLYIQGNLPPIIKATTFKGIALSYCAHNNVPYDQAIVLVSRILADHGGVLDE